MLLTALRIHILGAFYVPILMNITYRNFLNIQTVEKTITIAGWGGSSSITFNNLSSIKGINELIINRSLSHGDYINIESISLSSNVITIYCSNTGSDPHTLHLVITAFD